MGFLSAIFSGSENSIPESPSECLALFKAGDIGKSRQSQRQYNLIQRAMGAGIKEAKVRFVDTFSWESNNAIIIKEVRQIIEKALDEDDHDLKLLYAEMLVHGRGFVARNPAQAWLIYTELANKGSPIAAYEVGLKALRDCKYQEAISWLTKADLGDFGVNQALGDAYMRGLSIPSRALQEFAEYITNGTIGFADETNSKPTTEDVRLSLQYYRNAINFYPSGMVHPNCDAMYAVADCIRILGFENKGLINEFVNNLVRASEYNHFRATFDLACLYSEDKVVPLNLSLAKKYARSAISINSKSGGVFVGYSSAEEARRVVAIRRLNEILGS